MRCIKHMWIGGMVAVLVKLAAGAVPRRDLSKPKRPVITPKNIADLTLLTTLGEGIIRWCGFSADQRSFIGTLPDALVVYPLDGSNKPLVYRPHVEAGFVRRATSSDGLVWAYQDDAGTVSIRNILTETELYRFALPTNLTVVQITNDYRTVLATHAEEKTVWDAANGQQVPVMDSPTAMQTDLSIDGRFLVIRGAQLQLWDIWEGRVVIAAEDALSDAMFRFESNLLMNRTIDRVWLVDPITRQLLIEYPLNQCEAVMVSANWRWLVTYNRAIGPHTTSLTIVEIATGQPTLQLTIAHPFVHRATVSPDGSRLIVAIGMLLQVWDVATATLSFEITDFDKRIEVLHPSPNGDTVLAQALVGVRWWDRTSGASRLVCNQAWGSAAVAPDGLTATVICGQQLLQIDMVSGALISETLLPTPLPYARQIAAVSSNARYVAYFSADDSITIRDLMHNSVVTVTDIQGANDPTMGFSVNGHWLVVNVEYNNRFAIESATGSLRNLEQGVITWNAAGRMMVYARQNEVVVVDTATESTWRFAGPDVPSSQGYPAFLCENGSRLLVSNLRNITIFALDTQHPIFRYPPLSGSELIRPVLLSSEGDLLGVRTRSGRIEFWDVDKGTLVLYMVDSNSVYDAIRLSPDGTVLWLVADAGRLQAWGLP